MDTLTNTAVQLLLGLVMAVLIAVGCQETGDFNSMDDALVGDNAFGSLEDPKEEPEYATIQMALQTDNTESECEDPTFFRITLIPEEGVDPYICEAPFAPDPMSGVWVDGDENDTSEHQWVDCFQGGIAPGTYYIAVELLDDEGEIVPCCEVEPESFNPIVTIESGLTTEVVVKIICGPDDDGAFDGFGWVNHKPQIDNLVFDDFKFENTCEPTVVTVSAFDPDLDELTYWFEILEEPQDAVYQMTWSETEPTMTLISATPGDFLVQVTVMDEHGEAAMLSFPIHIVPGQTVDCLDCMDQ